MRRLAKLGWAMVVLAGCAASSVSAAPKGPTGDVGGLRARLTRRAYASQPTPFAPRVPSPLLPELAALIKLSTARGREGDGRLSEVAEAVASAGPDACDDIALLMSLTRAAGLPNPLPQALCVSAGSARLAADTLGAELPKAFDQLGTSHVGLGAAQHGEALTLVALLDTRRLVLAPVPRKLAEPGTVRVDVSVLAPLREPRLVVTRPNGATAVEAQGKGNALDALVALPEPGLYGLEIVAVGRHGPEVAANLRVAVATDEPAFSSLPRAAAGLDATAFEASALAELAATRRDERLPALSASPALADVARGHAKDMERKGYFGHVDARGRGPMERVEAGGLSASAVHENLARVATPLEAHTLWLESPAHRAALLAEDARQVGIGAVRTGDGAFIVVALYARLVTASPLPAPARTRKR